MPAPLPLAAARGWRKVVGHGQGGQAWTSRGPHVHLSTRSSPVSPSPWASGKALSLSEASLSQFHRMGELRGPLGSQIHQIHVPVPQRGGEERGGGLTCDSGTRS